MAGSIVTDTYEARQGSAPATPGAGKVRLYWLTGDPTPYVKDSAGVSYAVLTDSVAVADKLLLDNLATAWSVLEGTNNYLVFTTTNGAEAVTVGADPITVPGAKLELQAGTGGWFATSTGAILLDATTTLELNSSGGKIQIGNDAVNQGVDIATAGTRTLTVGSATATHVHTGVSFTWNVADNVASAWVVQQNANKYIEIVTTDGAEQINFATANLSVSRGLSVGGSLVTQIGVVGGAVLAVGGVAYVNGDSSTEVLNSTAETAFNKSKQFAANTFGPGRVLRIRANGVVVDTNGGAQQLTLRVRLFIGAGPAVLNLDTVTFNANDNDNWFFDLAAHVLNAGAAVNRSLAISSQRGHGAGAVPLFGTRGVVGTFDSTQTVTVEVSAQWLAASLDNRVSMTDLEIDVG